MTPGEAYPIFVEAIQAAKNKGIEIVGGSYGVAKVNGTFVPDIDQEQGPEVCPVGAVVLNRCATCHRMLQGVADLLSIGQTQVLAITNGVDGTDPSPLNRDWYDLGARLRREFNIPNVYDRKIS